MRTNQTFHRNETAVILCHGDPGDPPQEIIWIRNDGRIILGDFTELHEGSDLVEALIIENIQDSEAGEYVCGYNSSNGSTFATINVNVIVLPNNSPTFSLQSSVSIRYGSPLDLECSIEPDNPSLQYTWFTTDSRIENRTLFLLPNQVDIGVYRCSVYTNDGTELEHSIFVNVTNIPPLPENVNLPIIRRLLENEELVLYENFELPPDPNNLSIQWEKVHQDTREIIDSDPRFMHTFSARTLLVLIINDTRLSDDGNYRVTILNQFGCSVLMVRLHITPLDRTTVQLRFMDVSCEHIQV